jgi:hypothetical protein
MARMENRCDHCGGKFGLVHYPYWGRRFCRRACKDSFLARLAKERRRIGGGSAFFRPRAHRPER